MVPTEIKRGVSGTRCRGLKTEVSTPKGLTNISHLESHRDIVSRTKVEGQRIRSARSSSRFIRANIHCGIGTFTGAPEIAFALPETVVAGRMTVGTINHLQCADFFRIVERFRRKTHDGLNDVRMRIGLAGKPGEQPTPPDWEKCVVGTLDDDLRREAEERLHRDLERPATPNLFRSQSISAAIRHPELSQAVSGVEGLCSPWKPPGSTRDNQNFRSHAAIKSLAKNSLSRSLVADME